MPDRKTIFVVGAPRSGTTLMGRILGSHDSIFVFHELRFFSMLWNPNGDQVPLSRKEASRYLARLISIHHDGYYTQKDPQRYAQEVEAIAQEVPDPATAPAVFATFLHSETIHHGKTIPCEHSANYIFYLREILDTFPQARVVNMIRDPRDVLMSRKNMWRQYYLGDRTSFPLRMAIRMWAHYHPITTSLAWRKAVRIGDGFGEHPRVFQMHFEHLLESPEDQMRRVCAFLGVDFQPQMLEVPHLGSSSKPGQPSAVGIDRTATGRWREESPGQADWAICQWINKEGMTRHDYLLEDVKPTGWTLAWAAVTWPIKSALSFLTNLNLRTLRFLFGVAGRGG